MVQPVHRPASGSAASLLGRSRRIFGLRKFAPFGPKVVRYLRAKRAQSTAWRSNIFRHLNSASMTRSRLSITRSAVCGSCIPFSCRKANALSPLQLEKLYRQGQDRLRRYAVTVQKAVHHRRSWGDFQAADLTSNRSEAAYQLMVRRAKGLIAAGDIYQCNLSQNFSASWSGDPWTLYRDLTRINPRLIRRCGVRARAGW